MWRIKAPDGELSAMVNRTRARDAARSILRDDHPRMVLISVDAREALTLQEAANI
jgi:hypothetical protein